MREFTSGKSGKTRPIEFKLDGEEFTATIRSDADSVLEWSEITDAAMSADADMTSPAGVAIISKFFRLFMEEHEYRRMRRHLREQLADPAVLQEIMQALNEEMEKLVEEDAERPTKASSSSSTGHGARDERTLQIASAEDGDVVLATRPNRQARRAADQRQAREARRTG